MRTILVCAVAIALIAGAGVLWPNDANLCNASRLPSFAGRVESLGRKAAHDTQTCWIIDVRDSKTGELHKVPLQSQEETLKLPIGSPYSR